MLTVIYAVRYVLHAHTDAFQTYRTAYKSSLPEDELKSFETCRRKEKLNINVENCAFLWFVLYNFTTMHGVKNI
jgi:hypothetical protein